MAIAFVAAGTTYSNTAGGTTFTLNKPAGVSAGDRIYALVACWANGSQKTITATGWTVLNTAFRDMGTDELQLTVLTRYVEAGDPASWTATASGTVYLRVALTAAYSGVQETGNRGTSTTGNGSSFSTATVNATEANSWRTVFGAYFSGSASYNISSNETIRRAIEDADNSGAVQAAIWDSNATIATGNTSRSVSRSANWTCAASVIVLLEPSTGTPASGDLAGAIAAVEADADGEAHNDATVSASLPAVVAALDGYGQPPTVTGTAAASIPAVTSSLDGGTVVSGSMDAIASVSAEVTGETRFFGIRTIIVEADDRTIEVESRAVAD